MRVCILEIGARHTDIRGIFLQFFFVKLELPKKLVFAANANLIFFLVPCAQTRVMIFTHQPNYCDHFFPRQKFILISKTSIRDDLKF